MFWCKGDITNVQSEQMWMNLVGNDGLLGKWMESERDNILCLFTVQAFSSLWCVYMYIYCTSVFYPWDCVVQAALFVHIFVDLTSLLEKLFPPFFFCTEWNKVCVAYVWRGRDKLLDPRRHDCDNWIIHLANSVSCVHVVQKVKLYRKSLPAERKMGVKINHFKVVHSANF